MDASPPRPNIPSLLETLGRTPSATSRATGLARSTIQRVSRGTTSPTIETLREFALAAGYDVTVSLVQASDPLAAVGARVILDPATPSLENLEAWKMVAPVDVRAISAWVARLERQAGNDPKRQLELAGRLAAPQHRTGARYFAAKPGTTQERVINVASSALGSHVGALSGVVAAHAHLGHAPDPGPVLVWTNELDAVSDRLAATLREMGEYQPAGVLLAPTTPEYFIDMVTLTREDRHVVSPIQAALDLYGLGYDGLATEITAGW